MLCITWLVFLTALRLQYRLLFFCLRCFIVAFTKRDISFHCLLLLLSCLARPMSLLFRRLKICANGILIILHLQLIKSDQLCQCLQLIHVKLWLNDTWLGLIAHMMVLWCRVKALVVSTWQLERHIEIGLLHRFRVTDVHF